LQLIGGLATLLPNHLHSVVSEVAWDGEGSLCPIGWPDPQVLTQLFEYHVLEMLTSQRRLSWARLLKKIYEVDPLTCPPCGCRMGVIAMIEESEVIPKILQHLNLWERPQRSPPPRLFPHKLEGLLASLTPQQAQQIRASTDSIFWDNVPVWEA